MKKNIVIIILLIFGFAASANDGSYDTIGRGGGSLIPVRNNSITMEKEKIHIDLYRESEYRFNIKYDCTFYFRNITDSEQRVTMGFPHELNAYMGPDYEEGGPYFKRTPTDPVVKDFAFIVDGNNIGFKALRAEPNDSINEVPAYDVVYTTEVVFKPGEKKTIRNTYSMPRWHNEWPATNSWQRNEKTNSFDYILLTGLTWKEPIGQADITITFHVPKDTFDVVITPSGFTSAADQLRFAYHQESFIPKSDVHASFSFKKPAIGQTEKLARTYLDTGEDESAYYLLRQWDVTTIRDKKTKKEKDTIRNLAYKLAEKFYRKDSEKAMELYQTAARHAYSYDPEKDIQEFLNLPGTVSPAIPFWKWEIEGETNAPCYYVFYNIGCLCAMKGDIDIADYWLKNSFAINPKLSEIAKTDKDLENLRYKDNPLLSAIKNKDTIPAKDIDPLIKKEYINDHDLDGITPLMYCVKRIINVYGENADEIALCKKLLDKGADANARDKRGRTALHFAREYGSGKDIVKAVELLLKYGADPQIQDYYGTIPLAVSLDATWEQMPVVSALLRSMKNPDIPDHRGRTPLMIALNDACNPEIAKLILDKGADPNLADKGGRNALHYLCMGRLSCEPDIRIKLILPKIKDINKQDTSGRTAFHYLCANPYFNDVLTFSDRTEADKEKAKKLILYFLDNKTDPAITDYRGSYAYEALPEEFRIWYANREFDKALADEKYAFSQKGTFIQADITYEGDALRSAISAPSFCLSGDGSLTRIPDFKDQEHYIQWLHSAMTDKAESVAFAMRDKSETCTRDCVGIFLSRNRGEFKKLSAIDNISYCDFLAFSPDKRFLLSILKYKPPYMTDEENDSLKLCIYDTKNGNLKTILSFPSSQACWLNNREILFWGDVNGDDSDLCVYDFSTGSINPVMAAPYNELVEFHLTGKILTDYGYIDLAKKTVVKFTDSTSIKKAEKRVWTADGKGVLYLFEKTIYLFDTVSGKEQKIIKAYMKNTPYYTNTAQVFLYGRMQKADEFAFTVYDESVIRIYICNAKTGYCREVTSK